MEKTPLVAMDHAVVPLLSGLEFTFVCSADWAINQTPWLRTKIECGMLYVKPGKQATGFRDIPVSGIGTPQCKAVLASPANYVARVAGLLRQAGWSNARPCFALHPALRGWFGIMPPARFKAIAGSVFDRYAQGADPETRVAPCAFVRSAGDDDARSGRDDASGRARF